MDIHFFSIMVYIFFMDIFTLFIAVFIIIILLAGIAVFLNKRKQAQKQTPQKVLQQVKCPVCQSGLFKGENIISKVYRPRNVPDQLCTISGCPHCYPETEPGVRRTCPVCHANLAADEALTARLFNKSTSKSHVHILGCPHCRKNSSNID